MERGRDEGIHAVIVTLGHPSAQSLATTHIPAERLWVSLVELVSRRGIGSHRAEGFWGRSTGTLGLHRDLSFASPAPGTSHHPRVFGQVAPVLCCLPNFSERLPFPHAHLCIFGERELNAMISQA